MYSGKYLAPVMTYALPPTFGRASARLSGKPKNKNIITKAKILLLLECLHLVCGLLRLRSTKDLQDKVSVSELHNELQAAWVADLGARKKCPLIAYPRKLQTTPARLTGP